MHQKCYRRLFLSFQSLTISSSFFPYPFPFFASHNKQQQKILNFLLDIKDSAGALAMAGGDVATAGGDRWRCSDKRGWTRAWLAHWWGHCFLLVAVAGGDRWATIRSAAALLSGRLYQVSSS